MLISGILIIAEYMCSFLKKLKIKCFMSLDLLFLQLLLTYLLYISR